MGAGTVPLTLAGDERDSVLQESHGAMVTVDPSSENSSREGVVVGFGSEDVRDGGAVLLAVDGAGDQRKFPVQAMRSVAVTTGSREKLQVRGRGRGRGKGSNTMRGSITSACGDDLRSEARGAGALGRGRKGRLQGIEGLVAVADIRELDSTDSAVDGSTNAAINDKPYGDLSRKTQVTGKPGQDRRATGGRDYVHPGDSFIEGTFEDSKEFMRWLSEITIISSCYSDAQLAGATSPALQLAFDGSEECGPSVTLPVFKSAAISNSAEVQEGLSQPCSDVVLHIGGPIWALDWCPRRPGWVHSGNENLEFLAVGAHPSSVPYNRLGKLLKGQGLLQIWAFDFSMVDQVTGNSYEGPGGTKRSRGRGSSSNTAGKRPRTSSRETVASSGHGRSTGTRMLGPDVAGDVCRDVLLLEDAPSGHGVPSTISGDNDAYVVLRNSSPATQSHSASSPCGKKPRKLKESARARGSDTGFAETRFPRWHREEGPAKMVLGLIHDGLVTWDAKWRPVGEAKNPEMERELFRLGFIALLLGDGSIQVFDVPLPSLLSRGFLTKDVRSTVRIGPVFRCSDLRSGGHKSIPLSLEWSTWDPHDLILVGFHDGTVGLWKFISNPQLPEARPLMFFTADSLPLRSVVWAPDASGSSGNHVFVTAGHTGWVKFWDIRDPFRPIWDLQVSRGCIHSMDWIPWPRCVLMTLDDGTLRILGLDNAFSSTPATGEPWHGTHSQGIQCYLCSSFPIWDAQVSRSTGVVAYAGANGSVLQFQLTEKAVVKEGARAREPHYLCGAFVAKSRLGPVTLTSLKETAPAQMRKSSTEWSSRPRTMRGFLATCTLDNESKQASKGLELAVTAENSPSTRVRKKHSKAIGKIRSKDGSQSSSQKAELELLRPSDEGMTVAPSQTLPAPGYELKGEDGLREQSNNPESGNTPAPADNFPCHNVSVHRLRWNCNPNREHWLAYGGAAGIVRCQQVFSMKKKKKRDS